MGKLFPGSLPEEARSLTGVVGTDAVQWTVHPCVSQPASLRPSLPRRAGSLCVCARRKCAARRLRPRPAASRTACCCRCPHSLASTVAPPPRLPVLQVRREASALAAGCLSHGVLLPLPPGASLERLSADQALQLARTPVPASAAPLAARLSGAAAGLSAFEQYLHLGVLACGAAAAVRAGPLPPKLNAVIQPLMNAVRKEPEAALQRTCARALAELMRAAASRAPCPNDKLVRNVVAMVVGDPAEVPCAGARAEEVGALQERRVSHEGSGTSVAAAAGARGGVGRGGVGRGASGRGGGSS
eukprot:366113-Chlamydomonas_euryale.AAC.1